MSRKSFIAHSFLQKTVGPKYEDFAQHQQEAALLIEVRSYEDLGLFLLEFCQDTMIFSMIAESCCDLQQHPTNIWDIIRAF